MAAFLGGLEYVLEEGPRKDWLSAIPAIATVGAWCIGRWLRCCSSSDRCVPAAPIVRAFALPHGRPSSFACVFNLVIGFGLYSATYLVPVYLGRVRDFDSLQIGTTVVVTGIAQILSVVVAASLSNRVDPRYVITAGLTLFAASLWMSSFVTPEWGFDDWLWPQALRGFSILLCIVPSVNLALTGFAGAELRAASGLFNLMRNLGGAIGIATVNTWLADNARIQAARVGETLGESGRRAADFTAALAARIGGAAGDPRQALLLAKGELARLVGRTALTSSFDEVFRMMAWLFLAALVMVPFCRPAPLPGAAPADAH